jgi:hypothetical protein
VINAEINASQSAKQHQHTSIHLQQLLDEGVRHLPSLLVSEGAAAQDVSMTLLAYAYAGYAGDLGPVLQAVADNLDRCLQRLAPQNISNALWALGKLCDIWVVTHQQPGVQSGAYNKQVFSHAVQQLSSIVQASSPQLTAQNISNTVYGCALAGHMEDLPHFLACVCQHPELMDRALPQHWSNIVWGTATLYESAATDGDVHLAGQLQQYGQLLLSRCVQTPGAMTGASHQNWSNTIWAAAKLGCVKDGAQLLSQLARSMHSTTEATPQSCSNTLWAAATLRLYDQGLFTQAMQELAGMPPAAIQPQHFSNSLWACAVCAHWGSGVQQLLGRVGECDLAQFDEQHLANTSWAWAVLACLAGEDGSYDQHDLCFQQVAAALFKEAAARPVTSFSRDQLSQLYRAHLYAEQHLGIPGLPAGQVLEAARAEGLQSEVATISPGQKQVNSCLRQMGYSTQLEGLSPDSLVRADIVITALPDGRPCCIAVEFDGPPHYMTEQAASTGAADRLEGPTRLRNLLLSRCFPDGVLCIYWRDWAAAEGGKEARKGWLRKELAKLVRSKVGALVAQGWWATYMLGAYWQQCSGGVARQVMLSLPCI